MLKSSSISKKDKITSIAIGGFDGLHRAHQELLSRLDDHGAILIVEKSFSEALTPGGERCRYSERPCFFLDFSTIKEMSAEDFTAYLHEAFPALRKIVVGYDFRFGKDRLGTPETFRRIPGVEVEIVSEQKEEGISIHANTIRTLIKEGKIALANRLLGRPYRIRGRVVSGQGLGKEHFFPTLNLQTQNFLLPREGVYLTEAIIGARSYPALTFIGKRLSTDNAFSVETHILNDVIDGPVEEMEILFLDYLRENQKFEKFEDLKKQIAQDVEEGKRYFQAQA